jgi:hypothetical protein
LPPEVWDSQPRIALMMAQMAADSGNEETGASILNRSLLRNPQMAVIRMRLAALRLKQNSADDALTVLEPIRDSSDPRVIELLANSYIKLNRRDDALSALKKLDKTGKGNAETKRGIALLEIAAGQTEQGIKDLPGRIADPTNLLLADPLIVLLQQRRFSVWLSQIGWEKILHARAYLSRRHSRRTKRQGGRASGSDKAVQADPGTFRHCIRGPAFGSIQNCGGQS